MDNNDNISHHNNILITTYIVLGYSAFSFDDQQLLGIGNNFGCFIVGSDDLSPADSILYKARDVTATVDNAGLIIGTIVFIQYIVYTYSIEKKFEFTRFFFVLIASIISKKAAAGIKYLILDLKVGTASFFQSIDEAKIFGKQFVCYSII